MKPLLLLFLGATCAVAAPREPVPVFEAPASVVVPAPGKLDALVEAGLRRKAIEPAPLCSDAVFLRRVYLDVIGTLPTADEARRFLDDASPDKRALLINALLERDEFADYWGMKWGETLRVKSEFPINLWPNAAQAYDRWIRTALRENMPFTRFAWELLTASGSNFRAPQVNFYRSAGSHDPKALARIVALTFMGERTEAWPEERLTDMAAFFSKVGFKNTGEWKEEIVYFNGVDEGGTKARKKATLPDGTVAALPPDQDPREIFAQWLLSSKNSPFAKATVNRVWFWLMGRGIVQEADDLRPGNPPANPELLDWLAQQLAANRYDLKAIYRVILLSRAYQRSCIPAAAGDPAAEKVVGAWYPMRRMEAEVLLDAINGLTGARDEYSSMTPEPFTWVPDDKRTIVLPDGSLSSAVLDLFGRPPRDSGLLSERNNRPTATQRLHLLNSGSIQAKMTRSDKLKALLNAHPKAPEAATELYLTILSRYPSPEELATFKTYSESSEAKGQQVLYDLAWALLNDTEFLYRH
ncbi:MAG: DUF1553 domain-containing protein [Chthoniobacteraceae bacterium]